MFPMRQRNRVRNCPHKDVTTTSNYGLIRTVCRTCGNVHIEDQKAATQDSAAERPVETDQSLSPTL